MMKRFLIALTLAASFLVQRPTAGQAQDFEVKGPLAGAPAVMGMRIYREMRLQVQLQGSATLTDEFAQSIFFGGQLQFHPFDWLGVGVWGGFAPLHITTALSDEITAKSEANYNNVVSLPDSSNFPNQIGHLNWMVAPQVSFIPLRGKLGIFEALFIDTDLYVFGGLAIIGLEERGATNAISLATCPTTSTSTLGAQVDACRSTQKRESRMAFAPTFGVGLSLYMTDFLAMTLEWRAFPFAWNTSGTDEVGNPLDNAEIDSNDRLSHFNHMFSLGFAMYLPTEPKLSFAEELSDQPTSRSASGDSDSPPSKAKAKADADADAAATEGGGVEAEASGDLDMEF